MEQLVGYSHPNETFLQLSETAIGAGSQARQNATHSHELVLEVGQIVRKSAAK
jgi:hypothetical protein